MAAVTEYEKMLNAQWYNPLDKTLRELRLATRHLLYKFNKTSPEQVKIRRTLQQDLFAEVGRDVFIEPPFFCDYGQHIRLGDKVFFNFNCVVLDVGWVTIGNNVFFGPAVQIYTVNHPLAADERRSGIEQALPINIADDVWIGGGVIICPGVSIGARSVIAAGSVVTKDVPADVVVAGNPGRVLRSLTADTAADTQVQS
ncbi:sugar O-acetyltransferase [Rheinheimera sp. UJ63]|uniref:sugar O-acetyltransferase n=1 Tax=Rheinheimera sp. UJ63 TaxID=2910157 RepID=UPI001F3FA406|nr:sugar O-acetyltransferase [Rheinheimera sp. UJ63]MCF4009807.1 sugar O-acetyltransferase [Rheinheimera sp. UJ63]